MKNWLEIVINASWRFHSTLVMRFQTCPRLLKLSVKCDECCLICEQEGASTKMVSHIVALVLKLILQTDSYICEKFFGHRPHIVEIFISKLGSRVLNLTLFVVIFLFIEAFKHKSSLPVLLVCLFSSTVTFMTSQIVKRFVYRQRPYDNMRNVIALISSSDPNSFPSDHAALCFCVATCLSVFYSELASLAFIVASLISFSRFVARLHYPTDIVAGAVLGSCTGLFFSSVVSMAFSS